MKQSLLPLAWLLLPVFAAASPVLSADSAPYRSYDARDRGYGERYSAPGDYGHGYRDSYRGGPYDPPASASDWGRTGGHAGDDGYFEPYAPALSDRFRGGYVERPRGDRDTGRYGDSGWDPDPAGRSDSRRRGEPPLYDGRRDYAPDPYGEPWRDRNPSSGYRFRGQDQAPGLTGSWWGGYRFRPLTDSEIERMRSATPGLGLPPEPRRERSRPREEAFGYEPDSWLRRYYGEGP